MAEYTPIDISSSRMAITHEVWDGEELEWKIQRDTMQVTEVVAVADSVVAFRNSSDALLVNTEKLIKAHTAGVE